MRCLNVRREIWFDYSGMLLRSLKYGIAHIRCKFRVVSGECVIIRCVVNFTQKCFPYLKFPFVEMIMELKLIMGISAL